MANMIPLIVFILITSVTEVFSLRKVVVLSFDGLRADSYTEKKMPRLWKLKTLSTAPDYMTPIFPSKTIVNLYSMATGVYPDVHGVYNNEMFDADGSEKIYKENFFDDVNDKIIPIWVENEKKDSARNSGMMMWPGGEFKYQGTAADHYEPLKGSTNWLQRVNTIINWIKADCNLVMAYFEDDKIFKANDMDALLAEAINDIDVIIEHFFTKLKEINLHDKVDLIIMSDHGTSKVPGSKVLKIEDYVTDSTIKKIVSGPLVFLKIPDADDRNTIYGELKQKQNGHFIPYIKDTFQQDWYIKDVRALEDVIVLVANPTYTFMEKEKFEHLLTRNGVTESTFMTIENGYDNDVEDMRAFFVGIGPSFQDNKFPTNEVQLIDVYPLLKALLQLKGNASDYQNKLTLSAEIKELVEPALVTEYESR